MRLYKVKIILTHYTIRYNWCSFSSYIIITNNTPWKGNSKTVLIDTDTFSASRWLLFLKHRSLLRLVPMSVHYSRLLKELPRLLYTHTDSLFHACSAWCRTSIRTPLKTHPWAGLEENVGGVSSLDCSGIQRRGGWVARSRVFQQNKIKNILFTLTCVTFLFLKLCTKKRVGFFHAINECGLVLLI